MTQVVLLGGLGSIAFLAVMATLLFGCAGRWDIPWYWVYLGEWTAASIIGCFISDPTLVKERIRPGPGGKDYFSFIVLGLPWLGQHVLAGLDARFHWSDNVPLPVVAVGLAAVAIALVVVLWAVAVNRFFSSVIRIQTDRGHHVITSGPYQFVRHPAYAVCPLLFVGGGLALNSWLAALLGLFLILMIVRRARMEDLTLQQELEGYAQYAQRVRYRMFPGVW